jgi:hypothetical protein
LPDRFLDGEMSDAARRTDDQYVHARGAPAGATSSIARSAFSVRE